MEGGQKIWSFGKQAEANLGSPKHIFCCCGMGWHICNCWDGIVNFFVAIPTLAKSGLSQVDKNLDLDKKMGVNL